MHGESTRVSASRGATLSPDEGFYEQGVAPVSPRDVAAVATMLARSFQIDAGYRFLYPQDSTRESGLTDFFTRNLRIHLRYRCTLVASDSDGPVATVTVRPPGGVPVSTWTMLRHGLLPMATMNGFSLIPRLLWLKRTYDALEHELGGGHPHWHVHMMAVRDDRQGRGFGGRMLRTALSRCTQGPPAAIALTTHREENVEFYRRAGFAVAFERILQPPSAEPYPVWGMSRAARVTSSST